MEIIEKCKEIILDKEKINDKNRPYIIYTKKSKSELEKLKSKLKKKLNDSFSIKIILKNEINCYLENIPNKNNIIITNMTRRNFDSNKYSKFKEKYFLIDYDLLTGDKYHILSANYEMFNFKQIKDESDGQALGKGYEGIMWNKPDKKINLGDFVYIYYSHMPDKCNRIMYKCVVIDDGYHFNGNEICYDIINGKKTKDKKIRLKFCEAYTTKEFNTQELINKYTINYFHLNPAISEELANAIDNSEGKITLKELSERVYNRHCYFENKIKSYKHNSFDAQNGLRYYEAHHLVEQNLKNKEEFPFKEVIDNSCNLFDLCPTCHRRIHYGKIEDRIKMVKELYRKNQEEIDRLLNFEDNENFSKYETRLEWILQQYVPKKYKLKPEDIKL